MAWGIETVVDEALDGHEVVHPEGGDHRRPAQDAGRAVHELMRVARHASFQQVALATLDRSDRRWRLATPTDSPACIAGALCTVMRGDAEPAAVRLCHMSV
jgi:hypothetical protein